MPTVPSYQQQVQSRGIGAPTANVRPVDNSGLVRGLGQVSNVAQDIFQAETDKADTAAVMDADQKMQEWQNNAMFHPQSGVYAQKGKNALDVTNTTMDSFDKAASEIDSGLTNERQRLRFKELLGRRRAGLNQDLNRYEYREREQYYDDVDKGQIETSLQSAALYYNEPDKIAQYQQKMAAVLESQAQRKGLPPEMAQAQLLRANSQMSSSVIQRMAVDNPYRAQEYFKQAQGAMTAEDQVQIGRMIEREIKSRELEVKQAQAFTRAELSSRVQDASAAYLQGFDFAKPPSKAEFIASYGAEDGAQRYDEFLKVQNLGSSIRELATAAPEERQQILERWAPTTDGVAQEGFKRDNQMFGVLVNAASQLADTQQKDPASYVARYSSGVRRAFELAQQSGDQADFDRYASASLAEQQRLGVQSPKLLPDAQADQIVSQFNKTDDGGNNSARLVQSLQDQWGKHWPDVYRQLQERKLPAAALVIGSGVDDATGSRLAALAPVKASDLKKGLESSDVTEMNRLLGDRMADFRGTLASQVGGDRTYTVMYDQAQKLALSYMADGTSYKDAVEKAVRPLVDDKYTVQGTYRVPSTVDASLVARGARLSLDKLTADDVGFAVPKGTSEEFAKERVKSALDKDGYWVTLPDESGLALYYGGAVVMDKNGKPVTRSFDELTGEAASTQTVLQKLESGRIKAPAQQPAAPKPYMPWLNQ